MGRRKIEIQPIKDDRNRSVTFLKRKSGLFKKAHELSVLCSADVMVIVVGANKKLCEYSSGDVQDILGKYQYYGPPTEHRGPSDFADKPEGDFDDEEDPTPPPDDGHGHQNNNNHAAPPQIHNQPAFQHVNHTASASPPVSHGVPYRPHNSTPQPRPGSRPPSRNNPPQPGLPPQHPQHHATPPPHAQPAQNGFAYVQQNPTLYNRPVTQQPQHPPPGQYAYPPPPAQPTPPVVTQHQQHAVPHHAVPVQAHHQGPPPPPPPQQHHQQPPPHPQHPQEQPPQHLAVTHAAQQNMAQDHHRRQSLPAGFTQNERSMGPPEQPPPQPTSHPEPPEIKTDHSQSPPQPKRLPSKSKSIYTPIDETRSILSQHWGMGRPVDSPKAEPGSKNDSREADFSNPLPPPPVPTSNDISRAVSNPQRAQSLSSIPEVTGISRTNSLQANRPQLSLQIPSEHSDTASADSTPKDGRPPNLTPIKGNNSAGPSPAVVLPPPSPSANALLSAGASGPPNPFARPPPPSTAAQNNAAFTNNNNNTNNSNATAAETPMSALPSHLMNTALLPSPSGFYPDWSFGRSGPDSGMLPSPLAFPTPVQQAAPGLGPSKESDETDKKRKTPEGGSDNAGDGPGSTGKKLKVDQ